MTIKLDFSNVTGGNFEPIPAGDYTVEIEKVENRTAKSGNEMLSLTFNVMEGEYEGRKIFDLYVLTEKALWKLKDLLVAVGVDTEGMVDLDIDDLVGEVFVANVEIQESPGYDPQNRIKRHKPLGEDQVIL